MNVDLPARIQDSNVPLLSKRLTKPTIYPVAAGEFQCQRLLLTEGVSAGVELLMVDTGTVRAAICPTRGMGLWKANIDGLECGWASPVKGPVHPNFVALEENNGLGWLDGFDELLVRCGMRSFGAPDIDASGRVQFGLHGRVGNLPARNIRFNLDKEHSLLEVSGEVHETRFLQYNLQLHVKYAFAIGEPTIAVHDRIENAGATPAHVQMLYHINVGVPFLEAGARLRVAADRVVARNAHASKDLAEWSRYLAPTPGFEEQVYFFAGKPDHNGWAKTLLTNKSANKGFAVHFQTETLPYLTQWKNTVAESDGYVTGLEPGTGFPNPRSFEEAKGRLVELAGGDGLDIHVKLEGLANSERLQERVSEIEAIAKQPILTDEFDAEWCVPR